MGLVERSDSGCRNEWQANTQLMSAIRQDASVRNGSKAARLMSAMGGRLTFRLIRQCPEHGDA